MFVPCVEIYPATRPKEAVKRREGWEIGESITQSLKSSPVGHHIGWLTVFTRYRYPKTANAGKLREIFLKVTRIRTKEERDEFLELIIQWEQRYGQYIDKQPEKGRVFSDIKRARSMLLKARPDMFHYLDDPDISFTTNGLESYFSRLKSHYRQHRGLRKKKLNNYFNWYFYYKPK
jgi:hypothetical protein